jgi:hypothetical protein
MGVRLCRIGFYRIGALSDGALSHRRTRAPAYPPIAPILPKPPSPPKAPKIPIPPKPRRPPSLPILPGLPIPPILTSGRTRPGSSETSAAA